MKISFNWLKDYIDTPLNAEATAELLTNIGLEVEGTSTFERVKGGLKGLWIGEVLTCERHPNADKLSLTTVNVGQAEPLSIVCGAPNVAKGQKVVVAVEGTQLFPTEGEPFTIKKGKIRGEVSQGMLCAEDEIGLGKSHDGIMVLPQDAPVGQPYATYVGLESDIVWDINLTPNRSDATNHMGVAFDLAAGMQIQHGQASAFKRPDVSAFANLSKASTLPMQVQVASTESCARYSGLVISGVKVAASPSWLQERLRAIGLNPINNIVDITNFVLHETGQPLHAFDYTKIEGQGIYVQTLAQDTRFTTLDGVERKLDASDLMICDAKGNALCMAGVFGGAQSGVSDATTTIFLESAFFNPVQVRRTSMRHGLRTDAATRFEKTTDINQTVYALQRAAILIAEIAGGQIASEVIDLYPTKVERNTVDINYNFVNRLMGTQLSVAEIKTILAALDMQILKEDEQGATISIPGNKVDVTRQADVIEEILRIYGYNKVEMPTTVSSVLAFATRPNPSLVRNRIADALSARGFNEMMATSMTKSSYYKEAKFIDELVYVNNTSNQHLDIMRPTMLHSGLEAIEHNQNRQNPNLKLYEFGKTYRLQLKGEAQNYVEEQHLSIFLSGDFETQHWSLPKGKPSNFYHLRSIVNFVFQRLGINLDGFQQLVLEGEHDTFAYGLSIQRGKQIVAQFGRVHPELTLAVDVKQAVYYADINWDVVLKLIEKNKTQYKALSKFPSVRRDLAMVLDKEVIFAKVLELAQKQGKRLLKEVNLFDIFEDENKLGKGKKSYAVSFTFQDEEKTMLDKDIDQIMQNIINVLTTQLQASIRS